MKQIDFKAQIERLIEVGYKPLPNRVRIVVPDAKRYLQEGLKHFCGTDAKWLPEYDKIADWLTDNKGRGLIMVGACGLGKSLIGMRILPLLINYYCKKIVSIYTAQELNQMIDDVMKKHIIYIDDIGTEEISNIYGNKRIAFAELVDAAEREGKLLIITTNLDAQHLTEKYGERTVDRLRTITKSITLQGKSLRK